MRPLVRWVFERYAAPGQNDPAPPDLSWLSRNESDFLLALRSEKRRCDWLRGRRLAKRLCRLAFPDFAAAPLSGFEILALPTGAPAVRLPDGTRLAEGTLSLSHRHDAAACAVVQSEVLRIGIDIEWIEPRSDALVGSFFTTSEQALLDNVEADAERQILANVVWSAKEAVLKAIGVGLSEDTRAFSCLPDWNADRAPDAWGPVRFVTERPLRSSPLIAPALRWREEDGYVATLAVVRVPRDNPTPQEGHGPGEPENRRIAPDVELEHCTLPPDTLEGS